MATGNRLPITDYRLPITEYRLPITYYTDYTDYTDYQLPIAPSVLLLQLLRRKR